MTRAAKSGEPAASRGTARTPRSRQPKKAGDPLGRVLAPKDDAVAGGDIAPVELGGESTCKLCEVGVGGRVAAHAAIAHDGDLPAVAAEIVDQAGQMRTHERSLLQVR